MNTYRFLFHLHTFKSYDGSISYESLYQCAKLHKITHIAVTEHDNLESYQPLTSFFSTKNYRPELIPACEYTTEVGDIIVLNLMEKIEFKTYKELIDKAKSASGLLVLPHPYKRKGYPKDLMDALDFYEIFNLRGAKRYFDNSPFLNKSYLYGVDAHNSFDLPGVLNIYISETDFLTTIKSQIPVPQLIRSEVAFVNKLSKQYSKLIKWWKRKK
ncbi:MAG: hypothetical protein K2Q22_09050 [Cytophagales bacterium]|nr:hypothetical protein [Cytophagales bacterium]